MAGLFVVFEGGDGAGKSTQASLLVEWLTQHGYPVCRTFEPGDSMVGARLRDLVLNPEFGEVAPRAEALMYAADKAQHVFEVVHPALARGEIVVCDRYVDSMLAYQGAGRVLELAEVAQIADWAVESLVPDLTVVLDVAPDTGVGGIASKDRVEAAGDEFHARARQFFLELAARAPSRYEVLPARQSREQLAAAVVARLEPMLSVVQGRL